MPFRGLIMPLRASSATASDFVPPGGTMTAQEIENQFQLVTIERDRYKKALEMIVLSANGFATCTVEYLEVIAEEALNPTK